MSAEGREGGTDVSVPFKITTVPIPLTVSSAAAGFLSQVHKPSTAMYSPSSKADNIPTEMPYMFFMIFTPPVHDHSLCIPWWWFNFYHSNPSSIHRSCPWSVSSFILSLSTNDHNCTRKRWAKASKTSPGIIIVPFSPLNWTESCSQIAGHLLHITPVAGANWGSLDGSLDGSLMIAPHRPTGPHQPIGPGASVACRTLCSSRWPAVGSPHMLDMWGDKSRSGGCSCARAWPSNNCPCRCLETHLDLCTNFFTTLSVHLVSTFSCSQNLIWN